MLKRYLLRPLPVLLALLFCSCNDTDESNELSVYVSDAPAEYSALNFRITAVEVSGGGEWTPLAVENGSVSLLTLINGTMQRVAAREMERQGEFSAVRFTFAESPTLTIGEETYTMEVDAAYRTVTVETAFSMNGDDRPLLFDIDAATSVTELGEDTYIFRPRISVIDMESCGAVQGGLQAGSSAMTYQALIQFADQQTADLYSTYSTLASATRGAFFIRLPPGEYLMSVQSPEDVGMKIYSAPVTVHRQEVNDLGIVILEAEPVTEE